MQGTILQISASQGGVPKLPVPEASVTPLGVLGDRQAHPAIHGGPDKAILLIAAETLDELTAAGYPVYPGALGENLTTRGLDIARIRIGDQIQAGGVILEITQPRRPCSQLDVYGPGIQAALFDARVKAGDFTSPRWGKGGFYARVLQHGWVRPGDIIAIRAQLA